ncbi:hypothetical protein KDX31_05790 [Amphritea atlantica]|uniref:Uncharacterized protein n=1 Tax=Amphritea atlantica TaxID=355243 RepID=A0ABY5GZ62_9GAMM|nr:hypothetical protein KDX31_05790 [Amphritea atlantica]
MECKTNNQTTLIHNVLSLELDFKVTSPTISKLDHYEEHDVLLYNWYLID